MVHGVPEGLHVPVMEDLSGQGLDVMVDGRRQTRREPLCGASLSDPLVSLASQR